MRSWLKNNFRTITKITLVLIYMVIVAGALVRMTGSGMGCPDWPKCFGYYIPPTEESQLLWQPGRSFKKGHIIIREEALLVAKENFTTTDKFIPDHWEPYTRHDYAVFNPSHTWTEYINRLFGALAGFATLFMAMASFTFWKKNKTVTLLSWLAVFGMGFQAWLGATVVYSLLAPVKITIHMVMALAIVALVLYILHITRNREKSYKVNTLFTNLVWLALILTVIQVVLGTQVRQFVDDQAKLLGDTARAIWLHNPDLTFYIHRSFSILVLVVNVFLYILNRKRQLHYSRLNWVMILIGIEILSGIVMAYFDFPLASQPVHLVIASVLFGVQFYLLLDTRHAAKSL
ncbi:COX15/CtaA family protein [Sinomicrobium weinanense]|uniref:COX15/CtaA family protein n=1 Tax=Sinomicrobium weinanense TaxID=2842200 RepID=A0A926JRC8_9FLAO|nr:COX15/CtaA family protein [Sinomicrobium weinanense]MBC9796033.1 COX15/CtaA family protein [Sinomicrobium weinanense]MBU3123148.1 COX15/CtaA family protein [Sinomicrobium weinanense]